MKRRIYTGNVTRERRMADGMCISCGEVPTNNAEAVRCPECAQAHRDYMREEREAYALAQVSR